MPGATADNRNPPCLVSGYYRANIQLEVKRAVRNCDVVYCNRASRRAFGSLESAAVGDAPKWQAAKKLREVNARCAASTAVYHGAKIVDARPSRGTRQANAKNTRAWPPRPGIVQAAGLQNNKSPA